MVIIDKYVLKQDLVTALITDEQVEKTLFSALLTSRPALMRWMWRYFVTKKMIT